MGLRKIFIFVFTLIILFPGEIVHAISFIPEFISHYNHHNEEHHQLSFINFVGEHFNEEHHESSKHHKQDECPTNHDHVIVSLTFVVEKKINFIANTENNTFFEERSPVPPYHFSFSEFHSSIWQPPKLG